MTTITWHELYHDALIRFHGDTPSPGLEAHLITIFEQRPAEVQAAILKISDRYTAGKVRSPWPVIRRELDRDDARHLAVAIGADQQRIVELVEREITNALIYAPTEDEIIDAAFGDHGRLKAWADDDRLRDRIVTHWEAQRPRAIATEQQQRDRATAWRQARTRTQAAKTKPNPDEDIAI